jgi:hypothetical protein
MTNDVNVPSKSNKQKNLEFGNAVVFEKAGFKVFILFYKQST